MGQKYTKMTSFDYLDILFPGNLDLDIVSKCFQYHPLCSPIWLALVLLAPVPVLQRICRAMLHCPTRCTSPGQVASDPASLIRSNFMVIEQQIWKITIFKRAKSTIKMIYPLVFIVKFGFTSSNQKWTLDLSMKFKVPRWTSNSCLKSGAEIGLCHSGELRSSSVQASDTYCTKF